MEDSFAHKSKLLRSPPPGTNMIEEVPRGVLTTSPTDATFKKPEGAQSSLLKVLEPESKRERAICKTYAR